MNQDKVKGTMDDVTGRVKRQAGEWTGDSQLQVEGAAQQIKGKAEKAVGNVKDAAHQMHNDVKRQEEIERERDRESEHVGAGPQHGRK